MKLDKMQFAHVLAHCVSNGMSAGEYEIEELDRRIDIVVPEANNVYPVASDVDTLMKLMHEGNLKIEAIKTHRKLTGYGLKESKDEVEKYWNWDKWSKAELLEKLTDSSNYDEIQKGIIHSFLDKL